jgi:hypothetical protein
MPLLKQLSIDDYFEILQKLRNGDWASEYLARPTGSS